MFDSIGNGWLFYVAEGGVAVEAGGFVWFWQMFYAFNLLLLLNIGNFANKTD